jgi:hypothetical protein
MNQKYGWLNGMCYELIGTNEWMISQTNEENMRMKGYYKSNDEQKT